MVSEYALAESPQEAAKMVADDPQALVMAGGTTLVPRATLGELRRRRVIGLARAGLDQVSRNGATRLGATAPLRAVAALEGVPALAAAARAIGGPALRSSATVGGNLFLKAPYGDLATVLLALDAELELARGDQTRTVALAEALAGGSPAEPGELLLGISVPASSGTTAYERCARLAAGAPAVVTAAARLRRDGGEVAEARVAVGAVAARALRIGAAEERLVGSPAGEGDLAEAAAIAASALEPADDAVASAWYRRRMAELHIRRALEAAAGEAP